MDPDAELGDDLDIYLDYEAEFGRNAINSAKQILIQKIREAEHERIYAEYIDKVGTAGYRRRPADRQRECDCQSGTR